MKNVRMHAELEIEALNGADPRIHPEDDPFLFQYGGLDEMQSRAEHHVIKERQKARQRHHEHVANWK